MTTSQCSKSHPSSSIVSLGGRLDQLGLGSLREDDVVLVAKQRNVMAGERRPPAAEIAPTSGRRRWMREREEREGAEEMETEVEM